MACPAAGRQREAKGRWIGVLAVAVAILSAAFAAPVSARSSAPAHFWGVNPVAVPTDAQVQQIAAGGVGSIRVPLTWPALQPGAGAAPDWSSFDALLEAPVRNGLQVLPVVWGSPSWVSHLQHDLPIAHLAAWNAFLREAVQRYGPSGSFWVEHSAMSKDPLPYQPIRLWQIWNEPNFFYFSRPVSPTSYAKLLTASHATISALDPGAQVILGGMFATPRQRPPRAYSAVAFLDELYARPGVKNSFDAVALHPYARDTSSLVGSIDALRATMRAHGDARTGLWITEIGWGSASQGPFQKGLKGQARELGRAFSLFRANRVRWRLQGVDWWSLTDDPTPGACSFCADTGLFTAGFAPKPAWTRFAAFAKR